MYWASAFNLCSCGTGSCLNFLPDASKSGLWVLCIKDVLLQPYTSRIELATKKDLIAENIPFPVKAGYQDVQTNFRALTREFLEHHSGAWCCSILPPLGLSPPGCGFIFSLHHFIQTVVLQLQSALMRWVFGRLAKFSVPRVTHVVHCLLVTSVCT